MSRRRRAAAVGLVAAAWGCTAGAARAGTVRCGSADASEGGHGVQGSHFGRRTRRWLRVTVACVAVVGASGGVVAWARARPKTAASPPAAQVSVEAPTTQLPRPAPEVGTVVPGPINGL